MRNVKSVIAAIALSTFLFSCTKEGPVGPQGPEGPQGPQGPQGAQGPAGSANVSTVLFTSPAWSGTQINITVPQITTDIYNSGVVLAYMNFTSVNNVYYHVPGLVANAAYQIRVYSQVGSMRFNAHNPDGSSATGTLPTVDKIKVVIIPAANVSNGRISSTPQQAILDELKKAGVDINNYEEVEKYYNLPD